MKLSNHKSRKVYEMASEYRFDYKKARPNRLAEKMEDEPSIVLLPEDAMRVFKAAPKKAKAAKKKKK